MNREQFNTALKQEIQEHLRISVELREGMYRGEYNLEIELLWEEEVLQLHVVNLPNIPS